MPLKYDLHEDEIILMHSQLENYFEHLEPGAGTINRFVRYNTFDTANPELNPGEIPSNQYVAPAGNLGGDLPKETTAERLCAPLALKPLAGAAAHYFPKTMQQLAFDGATGECTFEAFISIMKEKNAAYAGIGVRELKSILVNKYGELMRTHKVQMMKYYQHITANRNVLASNVHDFIMNSFHYMTHLDLWILAQHFQIPIVLIAGQIQYPLIENQQPALVLHSEPVIGNVNANANFYYVMTMGRARDVAPVYRVIRTGENEMKFSLSQCTNAAFVQQVETQLVRGVVPVADFVAAYVPAVVKKRVGLKAAEEGGD
jgi:hypothetical protein